MNDKKESVQLKEYANNIVGTWYNRIPNEILIFSFLDDLANKAQLLTTTNGAAVKSTYKLVITYGNQLYLQIWSAEGRSNSVYRIEILTANMLTVSSREKNVTTYQRKVDYAFANQLLEEAAK